MYTKRTILLKDLKFCWIYRSKNNFVKPLKYSYLIGNSNCLLEYQNFFVDKVAHHFLVSNIIIYEQNYFQICSQ